MNPIRMMGRAFYSKWVESVTHCEPKFEELPECYLLQLDDCMRAAVRALAASEPVGTQPVYRTICAYLFSLGIEGRSPPMPNAETIGTSDAA